MTQLFVVTHSIEDASTGEILQEGIISPTSADALCEKARKKHPAAFVKKVDPSKPKTRIDRVVTAGRLRIV